MLAELAGQRVTGASRSRFFRIRSYFSDFASGQYLVRKVDWLTSGLYSTANT